MFFLARRRGTGGFFLLMAVGDLMCEGPMSENQAIYGFFSNCCFLQRKRFLLMFSLLILA